MPGSSACRFRGLLAERIRRLAGRYCTGSYERLYASSGANSFRISLQEEGLIQDLCVKNKTIREDVSGDLLRSYSFTTIFKFP